MAWTLPRVTHTGRVSLEQVPLLQGACVSAETGNPHKCGSFSAGSPGVITRVPQRKTWGGAAKTLSPAAISHLFRSPRIPATPR